MQKGLSFDKNYIYINGKREKIMSGAMHYFRIMPEYWKDRLLKLKELGCNCVETYVCHSLHEKTEGNFDFSGILDLAKFLDYARELGLYAIVRPGPYICSEWDFGGLPWWFLKYPELQIRCSNQLFLQKITPYLDKVCEIIRPRLITNGGNVILVQIENEYGAFGNDKTYLKWLKDFFIERKIDCGFVTSDNEREFHIENGGLDDVLESVNYRNESVRCIGALKKYRPNQPGAVMELWNGKCMLWGEKIVKRDIDEVAESVKTALENAELVNLYMFHGGTNFGFMNGANDFGDKLMVQMTSYDVDAPVNEYGIRTPKYYLEQKVICEYLGKEIKNTAKDPVLKDYGKAKFVGEVCLKDAKVDIKKTKSPTVLTMEQCDQGYGYIVYSTKVFFDKQGAELMLPEIHDIAHVYANGKYIKTVSKHDQDKVVKIDGYGYQTIQILVENMGRINYGPYIADRKGLIGNPIVHDIESHTYLTPYEFDIYSIELQDLPKDFNGKVELNAPAFYEFEIEVDEVADTVLYLNGFTRGVAFINGFNLGRHWDIENSPNKLFIPAPLLKKGKNQIVVFDVLASNKQKDLTLTDK